MLMECYSEIELIENIDTNQYYSFNRIYNNILMLFRKRNVYRRRNSEAFIIIIIVLYYSSYETLE